MPERVSDIVPQAVRPHKPVVLPCAGGREYLPDDAWLDELQDCYVYIDVREHVRQARGWLLGNERPPLHKIQRWLTNYLHNRNEQATPVKRKATEAEHVEYPPLEKLAPPPPAVAAWGIEQLEKLRRRVWG